MCVGYRRDGVSGHSQYRRGAIIAGASSGCWDAYVRASALAQQPFVRAHRRAPPPTSSPAALLLLPSQEQSALLVANAAKFNKWFNVDVKESTEVRGATD